MTEKEYYWQDRQEKMAIGFSGGSWGQGDVGYYKGDGMYDTVTAQEFIASNTPDIQRELQIGDWVTVLDTPNVRKFDSRGSGIGYTFQITKEMNYSVGAWNRGEDYAKSGNEYGTNYLKTDFRMATEAEIATITGVQDSWKIGDVCKMEWLKNQILYDDNKGKVQWKGIWSRDHDRMVAEVVNGYAKLSDTQIWLPPKSQYPTYPGNVKVEGKYKVGNWIIGEGCYLPTMPCIVERVDGDQVHYIYACDKTKNHSAAMYIRKCRPDEIPQLSTSIPVTDESMYKVGQRVLVKTGDTCGKLNIKGIITAVDKDYIIQPRIDVRDDSGLIHHCYPMDNRKLDVEILSDAPNQQPIPEPVNDSSWWVKAENDCGGNQWWKKDKEYEYVNNDGKESSIWYNVKDGEGKTMSVLREDFTKPYQKTNSKAVTNQQLNKPTKTNNYVNEEHISSGSRYTGKAINLQSDHQAVKRGQARTGYSVCDRGQPGQTQRGYQGHGKAVSTM